MKDIHECHPPPLLARQLFYFHTAFMAIRMGFCITCVMFCSSASAVRKFDALSVVSTSFEPCARGAWSLFERNVSTTTFAFLIICAIYGGKSVSNSLRVAAFRTICKTYPNYGKKIGMNPEDWWTQVGFQFGFRIYVVEHATSRSTTLVNRSNFW